MPYDWDLDDLRRLTANTRRSPYSRALHISIDTDTAHYASNDKEGNVLCLRYDIALCARPSLFPTPVLHTKTHPNPGRQRRFFSPPRTKPRDDGESNKPNGVVETPQKYLFRHHTTAQRKPSTSQTPTTKPAAIRQQLQTKSHEKHPNSVDNSL